MLIVLSLSCLALLITIFLEDKGEDWRVAIAKGSTIWAVLLTFFTEILSLFKQINLVGFVFVWGLTNIVLIGIFLRKKIWVPRFSFKGSIFLKGLVFGIGIIVIAIGLIGLIAPPNTVDSMTYHMTRVVHWMQNESVGHYASHIESQLYQNPWASFATLHFQVLSGGDDFANSVQWLSMVGNIILVSLIAQELGASLRGQIFAMVFCATLPMGILQGSSTQNNHVLSFWLLVSVYFILVLTAAKNKWHPENLFYLGSSLGLTVLTKGTAYMYLLPFGFWLVFSAVRKLKAGCLKPLGFVGIMALLLNLGHYWRNFDVYGSPIGTSSFIYNNQVFGLGTLFSNVLRNVGLQLTTNNEHFNKFLENIIVFFHHLFHLDVNNPATTWMDNKFKLDGSIFSENYAGNFFALIVVIFAVIWIVKNLYNYGFNYTIPYVLATVGSFLVFCFVLKWQPWHGRLHLPFFILFSPVVGLVLEEIKIGAIANFLVVIMLLASTPWVLCSDYKPIINIHKGLRHTIFTDARIDEYFNDESSDRQLYKEAIKVLKDSNCVTIGLYTDDQDFVEYPIWVLLKESQDKQVKIKHINVKNPSKVKMGTHEQENFIPCGIFVSNDGNKQMKQIETEGRRYEQKWSDKFVEILEPQEKIGLSHDNLRVPE